MEEKKKREKKSLIEILSGILLPVMDGMVATGILKGLLILSSTLGVLDAGSDVYLVLYAAADAFFYFLPLALSFSAAGRFGCNPYVAFAVTAVLLYPDLMEALAREGGVRFLGIPVPEVSYSNSLIPALVTVWLLSLLEKNLNKIFPEMVRSVLVPVLCILVMAPAALLAVGPAMDWAGQRIADGYLMIYTWNPAVAGAVLAGLWPVLVATEIYTVMLPIAINNVAVYGQDTLLPVTTGMNYAIAGATLAIVLKTKDRELKKTGSALFFSVFAGGIAEPAIYGVVLKYRKAFYICRGCVAVGGIFAGIAGSAFPAFLTTCIITLPAMAALPGGWGFVTAAVIGFAGAFVGTYLFGFREEEKDSVFIN